MPKSRLLTFAVIVLLIAGGAFFFLRSTDDAHAPVSPAPVTAPAPAEPGQPSVATQTALPQAPVENVANPDAPSLDNPVHWESVDKLPRLGFQVRPEYPESLREQMLQAEVRVRLTIDENGNVARAEVLESPGPEFHDPALTAARQYKFEPATRDGLPVPFAVETTVVFDPRR